MCMQALVRATAGASGTRRSEVTLSRTHFGIADPPVRYTIAIVPPG